MIPFAKKIETHYRKKDGSISCGSLYGYNTTATVSITCPICKKNIGIKEGTESD